MPKPKKPKRPKPTQAAQALAAMESALQLGGVVVINALYDQRRCVMEYAVQHLGGNDRTQIGFGNSIAAAVAAWRGM